MDKSPDAFRTISEAADDLDLPQHVLRFWETRFAQIKPLKRGGGRRYYRPEDVDLLRGIRHLLYDEGYTIKGVQRILREQGPRFVVGIGSGEIDFADSAAALASTTTTSGQGPLPADADGGGEPSKRAVSIDELAAAGNDAGKDAGKSKSLLGRLRGGKEAEASAGNEGGGTMSAEDRRQLQSTLYELLECKRLLDQVRSD